jgi:hypothetical protein
MMVLPVCYDALTTTLLANFLSERKVEQHGYNMTIMILNNVQHSRLMVIWKRYNGDAGQHQ